MPGRRRLDLQQDIAEELGRTEDPDLLVARGRIASAADCTRPADSPARKPRLSSGETVNPATPSRNRRAAGCTRS